MPTVEVTEADFKRMQRIAEPLVDTPTTVVTKLLNWFEENDQLQEGGDKNSERKPIAAGVKVYSFEAPPPLVHVKLLSGLIGSRSPKKLTWDSMVALCIDMVFQVENDLQKVARIINVNLVDGKKVDGGYKYVPELGVSYQGVSAQHAASAIGKAARHLREGAYVDFIWLQKEDAFAPGQVAALSFDC